MPTLTPVVPGSVTGTAVTPGTVTGSPVTAGALGLTTVTTSASIFILQETGGFFLQETGIGFVLDESSPANPSFTPSASGSLTLTPV